MALRKFMLFHLSLVPLQQVTFETRERSREDWLRYALRDSFEFDHRGGETLFWVSRDPIEKCIFGVIQRKKGYSHHEPPDQGGRETISEEWQGAYVIIDPTHHESGQRGRHRERRSR